MNYLLQSLNKRQLHKNGSKDTISTCSNSSQSSSPSPPQSPNMIGVGRVFISGSEIESEKSMIATHDRNDGLLPTTSIAAKEEEKKSAMEDEYGEMTSDGHTYVYPGVFTLESGEELMEAALRYQTYGELNEFRDNVLVVCHALTGNASLHSWWGDLLGPDKAFDTSKYFVICANILGSCYGSTSPMSLDPSTNKPYGMSFPDISIRDTVRIQLHMLKHHLQIRSIKSVIGGSFGGMQAIEFAIQSSSMESSPAIPFVRSIIAIACGAQHTAWQIAISEVQRQAIYADAKWNNGKLNLDDPPLKGLSVARQIGMISYRTPAGYDIKFGRKVQRSSCPSQPPPHTSREKFQVQSYLEYQGQKFLARFDAVTYVKLTEQMDTHDIGSNRGGSKSALKDVFIPALVLGIDSDILYPLFEQEELVSLFPNATLGVIHSDAGHDGFLLEQEQVGGYITEFLNGRE